MGRRLNNISGIWRNRRSGSHEVFLVRFAVGVPVLAGDECAAGDGGRADGGGDSGGVEVSGVETGAEWGVVGAVAAGGDDGVHVDGVFGDREFAE